MKKEFLDPVIELVNFDENVVLGDSGGENPIPGGGEGGIF